MQKVKQLTARLSHAKAPLITMFVVTLFFTLITANDALACSDVHFDSKLNLGDITSQSAPSKVHVATRDVPVPMGKRCWVAGVGNINTQADLRFFISNDGSFAGLQVKTDAQCNAAILVKDGSGAWHFFEPFSHLAPSAEPKTIRVLGAPSGEYQVWIGALEGSACDTTVELEHQLY